jgi:hypothetical protein
MSVRASMCVCVRAWVCVGEHGCVCVCVCACVLVCVCACRGVGGIRVFKYESQETHEAKDIIKWIDTSVKQATVQEVQQMAAFIN